MRAQMQQMEQRLSELEEKLGAIQANAPQDQLSMVVFSGELDRMLAAFIIATGAGPCMIGWSCFSLSGQHPH